MTAAMTVKVTRHTLQGSESKLVRKSKNDLGELKDMGEVHGVDGVLSRVDQRAAVIKGRLKRHGGWVTGACSRSMVGATVSTLGIDSRERRVLSKLEEIIHHGKDTYSSNDLLEESSKTSVNVVGEDSNDFLGSGLDVASHVLVEHGLDLSAVTLVLLEDSATAEKTSLFSGVPVELDGVGSLAGGDATGSTARAWVLEVDGILPLGRLLAISGGVVSVLEVGEGGQGAAQVGLAQLGDEGLDCGGLGDCSGEAGKELKREAGLIEVGDVDEVFVFLLGADVTGSKLDLEELGLNLARLNGRGV
ncbi:hypothetical protein HG530_000469 [Fusarium avenaceum]|nr:hypothetical protein HG530_000469 [Fusarium avenaceum]